MNNQYEHGEPDWIKDTDAQAEADESYIILWVFGLALAFTGFSAWAIWSAFA